MDPTIGVEKLEHAIALLEAQRTTLGDAIVDTAIAPLRAQLAQLEGSEPQKQQRKLATVLFADITGSTEMSQGLEPEEVLEIMDGALQRLAVPVETHGGHITHFMGDGFMAVFGLPVAREKDASQAVRAGLGILEAARAHGVELEEERQIRGFNVRVGVSSGLVAFGGLTEAKDTVGGLTVNLAKRLETAAPPGGLLISEHTLLQVRGAFEVVPQQAVLAKGFPEPVLAFLVKRARPRTFRTMRRGVQGVEPRMVGRAPELQQLQRTLDGVVYTPRTHLLTIVGDAGIGKSRLLYEFDQWRAARAEATVAFKARASQQAAGIPFGLMRELLAYRFGILHSDPASVARLKFEAGLMQFFVKEPEMKAHFVGALLGYDLSESPHLLGVKGDARQMRAQALYYLTQFFTAVTEETPAVIMLDDIHWADRPSLEAITHIVSRCPALHLMVVCLARPRLFEICPDWGREQALESTQSSLMRLSPLPRQASYELVGEILQQVEALPGVFQEQIVSAAEGNPFFLEELVEIAIDDSVIRKDERTGAWRLDPDKFDAMRVPPTLTSVLQARLDSLPLAEKLVLRQASVIGRVFWSAALQALQGVAETPSAELAALSRREIIHLHEKSAFSDTDEYAFRHGLMRDVAYDLVLKRTRRAYHGQVAEWLVKTTQASGRTDEYTGVIAEHYEQACELEEAAAWFLRAGERAMAQGAPSEARRFLDRALKHLPETDRERRWRTMLARNQVLFTLGETETRIAQDKALVALAQELGDDGKLSQAYQLQGYCLGLVGRYREELEVYQTALAAAKRAANRQVEAEVLGQKVLCLTRLGQADRARRVAEEALARARDLGEDDVLVRNLTFVSVFYSEYGDSFRAAQLLEQQVAINRRNANRQLEAVGLTNLGNAYIQLGINVRAIEVLKRAVELARGIGHRQHSAYGLLNLGLAHLRNGELDQAHGELEASVSELEALQDRFGQAAGQSYLALTKEACGEHRDALERFACAQATLVQIGVHGCANDATAGLARCLMALGRVEEAGQQAEALWKHLSDNGPGGMEFPVLAYQTCADLFAASGDLGRSRTAVEKGYRELLDRADKIGDPAWRNSFLEKVPEHRAIIEKWRGG